MCNFYLEFPLFFFTVYEKELIKRLYKLTQTVYCLKLGTNSRGQMKVITRS